MIPSFENRSRDQYRTPNDRIIAKARPWLVGHSWADILQWEAAAERQILLLQSCL